MLSNPTAICATTFSFPFPASNTSASIWSRNVVISPSTPDRTLSRITLFGGASGCGYTSTSYPRVRSKSIASPMSQVANTRNFFSMTRTFFLQDLADAIRACTHCRPCNNHTRRKHWKGNEEHQRSINGGPRGTYEGSFNEVFLRSASPRFLATHCSNSFASAVSFSGSRSFAIRWLRSFSCEFSSSFTAHLWQNLGGL